MANAAAKQAALIQVQGRDFIGISCVFRLWRCRARESASRQLMMGSAGAKSGKIRIGASIGAGLRKSNTLKVNYW